MGLNEIDQRAKEEEGEKELMFRCNCGFDHFLTFTIHHDIMKDSSPLFPESGEKSVKGWKDFYVAFVDKKSGFWWKLRDCWNYLRGRKAEMCYTGIGITSKDMEKVIALFKEYQEL